MKRRQQKTVTEGQWEKVAMQMIADGKDQEVSVRYISKKIGGFTDYMFIG